MCSSLVFTTAKRFATSKENACCSEEQDELKTSLGFAATKGREGRR